MAEGCPTKFFDITKLLQNIEFSSWPTGGVNCTFWPNIDHTLRKLLTPSRQMKHLEFRHFLMTSVASFSSNFFSDMKGGISSKQTNSSFWINRLPTKVQLRQVHPYLPISAHKRRSKIFTFFISGLLHHTIYGRHYIFKHWHERISFLSSTNSLFERIAIVLFPAGGRPQKNRYRLLSAGKTFKVH